MELECREEVVIVDILKVKVLFVIIGQCEE